MAQNNNRKLKYIVALIFTVLLLVILAVTGTVAYKDYNQHKSNVLTSAATQYDVVLVNEFEPIEHWSMGDGAKAAPMYVKNSHSSRGNDTELSDIFVRVQLKEYMETSGQKYIYSDHRFMIDTDGNYERFETIDAANNFIASLENSDRKTQPQKVQGYFDDQEYYYIPTQAKDINGQFGLHLVMGVEKDGEAKPLIEGSTRADKEALKNEHHNPGDIDECDYPIVYFEEKREGWSEAFELRNKSAITEYIKVNFGDEMMTLEEWEQNPRPVQKWILDTRNEEGYMYWGDVLKYDESTAHILESVELLKNVDGMFYYAHHLDLEAVSKDDLEFFDNMPTLLKEEFLQIER